MGCRESRYHRQQAVKSERDVAIDPHQPAGDSSGSNRPFGLVEVRQDAVRSFEKCPAFGGEQQLAGRAIDQPRAQRLSNRATSLLTADGVMRRARAAGEKPPSSTTRRTPPSLPSD